MKRKPQEDSFLKYIQVSCKIKLQTNEGYKKVRTFGQPRKAEGKKRMEKMKIFKVYLDDGRNFFRVRIPAFDEKQAVDFFDGNGKIIAVREETEYLGICSDWLEEQLRKTDMNVDERILISRIVKNCGLGY